MKFLIKSRLWTFVFVASVMFVISTATGAPFISPEMLAPAAALPFMMGDTAGMGDLKDLLEKQGKAFSDFKEANNERLKAIESKGYAPADVVGKVEKINEELTQLGKDIAEVAKKSNRPAVTGGSTLTPEQEEYKTAFKNFMRKGGDTSQLSALERKALGRGSDVDGGVLVHAELETQIDRVASTVSAMRQVADVVTIGSISQRMRVKTSGLMARWVGENEAGGETTNAKFAMIEITAEEMEAEPWVYNDTLEDSDYNLETDVSDEAGIAFAEAEGTAFITGDGVKKARGIATYPMVSNASYAWGKTGYIATGVSGDFAASNPADKIIDLLHSMKSVYRGGAQLMMADTTLGKLRQIKDGSGNFYLFNPDPTGNFSGMVLGVPVIIDDNVAAMGANSYSIVYANFKRAYRIVDRRGITLIRDNLTTKGTTKFNFRKRVGAGIKNFEAIKFMKFGTS
ncbi:MAG: phage major capsid protein [Proteobacteria bacterium]|nr:phage major capsid protein [Pseudomonadota bacterium]